jgi:hypothetical protein
MPLILGFSAGAVIGVALFDLMPEALALGGKVAPAEVVAGLMGVGFCGYMLLERSLGAAAEGRGGHLGPASLTLHSLIDGMGIGLAFQVSPPVGVVVAAAVLAHDLADGVNTVMLSLSGGGGQGRARGWLAADASSGSARARSAWRSPCSPASSSTSARRRSPPPATAPRRGFAPPSPPSPAWRRSGSSCGWRRVSGRPLARHVGALKRMRQRSEMRLGAVIRVPAALSWRDGAEMCQQRMRCSAFVLDYSRTNSVRIRLARRADGEIQRARWVGGIMG